MNIKIEDIRIKRDKRGVLVDFLKIDDLENNLAFGQIYYITFSKKGVSRGNHYHKKKTEWLSVIKGRVKIILEDLKTKEKKTLVLDDKENAKKLVIGPGIFHTVTSLSDDAAMVNYANMPYHPDNTDTYTVNV
jgi:UDP-2-acetamido-2,6-beta-L-arabino-hexul-4-ose reductase